MHGDFELRYKERQENVAPLFMLMERNYTSGSKELFVKELYTNSALSKSRPDSIMSKESDSYLISL